MTGPWAKEFATAYENAGSDFARQILSDGQITDHEVVEMRNKFTQCLSGHGFTEIEFEEDGAFTLKPPEKGERRTHEKQVEGCSIAAGEDVVGALASGVRRNPENLDENTIIAACLVRKGVVAKDYSAEDYARDAARDHYAYQDPVAGPDALLACDADPLGLFE